MALRSGPVNCSALEWCHSLSNRSRLSFCRSCRVTRVRLVTEVMTIPFSSILQGFKEGWQESKEKREAAEAAGKENGK